MNNNPDSSDDYEDETDENYDDEGGLEQDTSEDAITPPRSLLTEIISVWISAVSLIFRPKAITFEEEIEFASWRRFWVIVVSGTILNTIVLTLTTQTFNSTFGSSRQNTSAVFDFVWEGLLALIISSFVIWIGSYVSFRWIVRQKIDTESDFLEHVQIVAITWLIRQVLLGVWTVLLIGFVNYRPYQQLGTQFSQGGYDLQRIILSWVS